jgi:hypothetical protein
VAFAGVAMGGELVVVLVALPASAETVACSAGDSAAIGFHVSSVTLT